MKKKKEEFVVEKLSEHETDEVILTVKALIAEKSKKPELISIRKGLLTLEIGESIRCPIPQIAQAESEYDRKLAKNKLCSNVHRIKKEMDIEVSVNILGNIAIIKRLN